MSRSALPALSTRSAISRNALSVRNRFVRTIATTPVWCGGAWASRALPLSLASRVCPTSRCAAARRRRAPNTARSLPRISKTSSSISRSASANLMSGLRVRRGDGATRSLHTPLGSLPYSECTRCHLVNGVCVLNSHNLLSDFFGTVAPQVPTHTAPAAISHFPAPRLPLLSVSPDFLSRPRPRSSPRRRWCLVALTSRRAAARQYPSCHRPVRRHRSRLHLCHYLRRHARRVRCRRRRGAPTCALAHGYASALSVLLLCDADARLHLRDNLAPATPQPGRRPRWHRQRRGLCLCIARIYRPEGAHATAGARTQARRRWGRRRRDRGDVAPLEANPRVARR